MTATFGGLPIFGAAVVMQAGVINPFRIQQNQFPAIDFSEELRAGADGAFTMVTGRLGGSGVIGLDGQEALFRSYYDGHSYVLVDTVGRTWQNVKLESFVPQDRIVRNPATGYCWRAYSAKFRHVTY